MGALHFALCVTVPVSASISCATDLKTEIKEFTFVVSLPCITCKNLGGLRTGAGLEKRQGGGENWQQHLKQLTGHCTMRLALLRIWEIKK